MNDLTLARKLYTWWIRFQNGDLPVTKKEKRQIKTNLNNAFFFSFFFSNESSNEGNVTLYIVHRKLCEMMEKLRLSLAFSLAIVPSANFSFSAIGLANCVFLTIIYSLCLLLSRAKLLYLPLMQVYIFLQ